MNGRDLLDVSPIIRHLLGCSWGRSLSTADDTQPCPERADRIVVLHDGPNQVEVRLCVRHVERIEQETTPHDVGGTA